MGLRNFISIFILLIFPTLLISQDIKVGIGGGYAYILNDIYYTGNVQPTFNTNKLGMKNCYTINAKLKYSPIESPIIFIAELQYLSAKNETDYMGFYSLVQSSPARMHLIAAQDIYFIGFAVESPIYRSIFSPYLSLGFMANYFGKTKIERTPKPEPFIERNLESNELIISNKLRGGMNVGLGVDYKFMKKFSLDILAKYNLMNLIGQKAITEILKEESFNTFSITAVILYSL